MQIRAGDVSHGMAQRTHGRTGRAPYGRRRRRARRMRRLALTGGAVAMIGLAAAGLFATRAGSGIRPGNDPLARFLARSPGDRQGPLTQTKGEPLSVYYARLPPEPAADPEAPLSAFFLDAPPALPNPVGPPDGVAIPRGLIEPVQPVPIVVAPISEIANLPPSLSRPPGPPFGPIGGGQVPAASSPLPEPVTWMQMLAGMAFIGIFLRRRRARWRRV